jgi:hypothetical protein
MLPYKSFWHETMNNDTIKREKNRILDVVSRYCNHFDPISDEYVLEFELQGSEFVFVSEKRHRTLLNRRLISVWIHAGDIMDVNHRLAGSKYSKPQKMTVYQLLGAMQRAFKLTPLLEPTNESPRPTDLSVAYI